MIIVALDKEEVVEVNKKASTILGYTKSELLGRNWFEFTPANVEIKRLFQQLQNGTLHKGLLPSRSRNSGESRIISWHITLFKDQSSELDFVLLSGEDVTGAQKNP